jgi:hypothetical protein
MRLAFAIAAIAASVGAAGAQSNAPWRDPSGDFTLDFASVGWEMRSPTPPGRYLAIDSASARAREKFITCEAEVLGPLPGSTGIQQAQANAGSQRLDIEGARRVFVEAQDLTVEHSTVDGVAVVERAFRPRRISPSLANVLPGNLCRRGAAPASVWQRATYHDK